MSNIINNIENGYIEIQGQGQLKRNNVIIGNITNSYKDFTIESGVSYQYSLDSKILESKPINLDYMFLSDATKQLKIKYNPKVSTFKKTILEQKVDTIGGTYPFIFRNNQTGYKEIQISGLISCLMDEDNLFNPISYIQSTDEYYNERKFREEVYEWLTNGKPKLFRSPTEGNCVIQLVNVSLSPQEALGRLLYSFNATGYEIMPYDIPTMIKYGVMNGNLQGEANE